MTLLQPLLAFSAAEGFILKMNGCFPSKHSLFTPLSSFYRFVDGLYITTTGTVSFQGHGSRTCCVDLIGQSGVRVPPNNFENCLDKGNTNKPSPYPLRRLFKTQAWRQGRVVFSLTEGTSWTITPDSDTVALLSNASTNIISMSRLEDAEGVVHFRRAIFLVTGLSFPF